MIQITGEVRAEAARGTGYTYMLRLVQLPAYGNAQGRITGERLLRVSSGACSQKYALPNAKDLKARKGACELRVNDGVGILNAILEHIATAYHVMFLIAERGLGELPYLHTTSTTAMEDSYPCAHAEARRVRGSG